MTTARTNMKKEIEKYKALPYKRELLPNEDGTWFGRIVEFPGCMTEGATEAEVVANLEEAMEGWIQIALEDQDPIPKPVGTGEFSGKFLVRIPKTLHRDLMLKAEREGVSLNQLAVTAFAKEVAA